MKTTLITILILSTGIGVPIYLYKSLEITEISVLRDITEQHLAEPNADEIIYQFGLTDGHNWNGAMFRFAHISDISYSKVSEIKIDASNKWLSNELQRKKEIQNFTKGVENIIAQAENDSIGRMHSSVFLPIVNELNRLSKSKSHKRILVVYSDLFENNLDVSLYSKGRLDVSQLNVDSLKSLFEHEQPLPDLTGIEVYLIYQPANAEMDREYKIVSEFYRKQFENKGAKVIIGGNLQI